MRALLGVSLVLLSSCHEPSGGPPPTQLVRPVYFDADRAAPPITMGPQRLPGAVTALDVRRGGTRFVWTREPAPAALSVTVAMKHRGATTAAGVAALAHVERNAERWRLDPAALATVHVASVIDTGRGAIVAKLVQRVDGIDVVRTHLSVVMDRDLALVALSGGLHPAARPARATPVVTIAARDALGLALDDAGVARPVLAATGDRAGYQVFTAPGLAAPARARRVLFPVGDRLVDGWQTEVAIDDGKAIGYRHVFAADDGRLLYRTGLTMDAAFTYRVWAEAAGDKRFLDGPQGDYTPHPTGTPDGFDPPFVAPSLVTIDGFNASHDPWLAANATTTSGNNVQAYADIDFDDGLSPGDIQPPTTAPGVFDYTYNPAVEPDANLTQRRAATVQLFYVNNWLHDYFYDSGFTEVAGNAQASNLGRGGVEGDVLFAEAQDASGTDNANIFVPGDGSSPRMQMFLFTAPTGGVRRDGTLDNFIIAHEWGHYLHLRLVECGAIECFSMSEGWGDFIAMMTSVRATDNLDATWGMGAYPLRSFTNEAAYFGIRRYPYSVDFAKSPLTLRFVQSGVPLPVGPAFSDVGFLQNSDNWEVHNSGEIWCAMLWEGLVDILKQSKLPVPRYSFDEARRRMADYVVAGLAAAPIEPSYTEQRDAILAAALAADQTDFAILANAFARRGFGTGAIAPPVDSFDGSPVTESFLVTGSLDVSVTVVDDAASCDGDGILDSGETGQVVVTVRNAGAAALAGTSIAVTNQTPGLTFTGATTANLGAIPFGETRVVSLPVQLEETAVPVGDLRVTATVTDASAAIPSVQRVLTTPANLDIVPGASALDTFEGDPFVWTASATGFTRVAETPTNTVVRVDVAAQGDHTLQTPGLAVTGPLGMTFRHRHDFGEFGQPRDGGVIEISTNGVDFVDVATVGNPSYTGTIVLDVGNVLEDRPAYTVTNAAFPSFEQISIDLGSSFMGQTVFVRFRAGGDVFDFSESTWEIDDVAFTGIANTPFTLVSPEAAACLVGERPIANAGANFDLASGAAGALDGSASADPDGGVLTFEWTQLSGPALALSSNTVAQPTFTAPVVQSDRFARFQLIVRDPDDRVSLPDVVQIRILREVIVDAPPDAGMVDAAVDAPPVDPIDAATFPDAEELPPIQGGGGGCCDAGSDPRGSLLLIGLLALLSRRGRSRSGR